jgi:hypothetical protein
MTIPTTTNQLLVAEDWKKIYQSYRNADFQSYDFETLRRILINYLQQNYPEDFNDYIESSEYLALVDLIAYMGQNLSFRIDLNARENFLETASRRDSILRLAQLIGYAPKRNIPANGFLKITGIATTDSVIDSNGINLANTTVGWNDSTNSNWYSQFISILNSAMEGAYTFGKPYDRNTINGILTEQYTFNSNNTDVPVFSFLKNINGIGMGFEIVSSSFSGENYIYEEPPEPANALSFVYTNDNQGAGSANTGFFMQFRQGALGIANFSITGPVPNEIIGINTPNINDTDVWLWQLDANGNYSTLWTKVPSVIGNNVIYNSLDVSKRNIYSVTSRDQDQIDLNFADGSFGNLPKGNFVLLYRQSNALTYSITPEQMSGIIINVPYTNKSGQSQILTITLGLQYTVSNSSGAETNASIQLKAPQSYYIQNRMVTGEDYNIAPLTVSNNILKVKSVARVTSGLSKYFELQDVSGKYSRTNIFASDGVLYQNDYESNFTFTFNTINDIYVVLKTRLEPIISLPSFKSFYMSQYTPVDLTELNIYWTSVNTVSGQTQGYIQNSASIPQSVGSASSTNLSYVTVGSLIKFTAPAGYYFSSTGKLVTSTNNTTSYIWAAVQQVVGDGSNSGLGALANGTGPITLSKSVVGNGTVLPIISAVIPKFIDVFTYGFETSLANLCMTYKNFGISFDKITRSWNVIADSNLNLSGPFNLFYQNDTTNSGLDASWFIAFVWNGSSYNVRYRLTNYVFESVAETAFYVDTDKINYDYVSNTIVKDSIDILSYNTLNTTNGQSLEKNYTWQIDNAVIESDGYVDPSKVLVSLYQYNSAGQIDDPDAFKNIVNPLSINVDTGYRDKFVYFQKSTDGLRYNLVDSSMFLSYPTPSDVSDPDSTMLYYFYDPSYNVVNSYDSINSVWVYESTYFAYAGRSGLKFHYQHNSGEEYRIDPSKSNIVDVYMLTQDYDTTFRTWLTTGIGTEPLPPTGASLELNYSANLESIKTISDEIVYQPVKYKILFGSNANINLQATFKAVKNPSVTVSDNDITTQILSAINQFFALENWDFGQQFNFSELSTYVMNLLTPNILNFIIVPTINNFGSLYQVSCLSNEIFVSGATVSDIEIIDSITASQLNTAMIVTNAGN